jgi:20S proteasome subunit beta 1
VVCVPGFAGWDPAGGGQVYSIPVYSGALIRQPIAISGSGSSYVYGYVDANFREGMSAEECCEFCKNTVSLAMARDGSSGGVIRMVSAARPDMFRLRLTILLQVTITKEGVERVYIPHGELPVHWTG